jgi:hypothetical protein
VSPRSFDWEQGPTTQGIESDPDPLDRRFHLGLVLVLTVVLGAALLGVAGPSTGRASASSQGVNLMVDHPSVARPGLAAPFDVTVTSDSPLPDPVIIELTADYLAIFDENGLTPDTGAILAVSTFTAWALATDHISFWHAGVARVLSGRPVIILLEGSPVPEALDSQRLSMDDLREAAREKGIGDLGEVWMGIAEPDGSFSFIEQDPSS